MVLKAGMPTVLEIESDKILDIKKNTSFSKSDVVSRYESVFSLLDHSKSLELQDMFHYFLVS